MTSCMASHIATQHTLHAQETCLSLCQQHSQGHSSPQSGGNTVISPNPNVGWLVQREALQEFVYTSLVHPTHLHDQNSQWAKRLSTHLHTYIQTRCITTETLKTVSTYFGWFSKSHRYSLPSRSIVKTGLVATWTSESKHFTTLADMQQSNEHLPTQQNGDTWLTHSQLHPAPAAVWAEWDRTGRGKGANVVFISWWGYRN